MGCTPESLIERYHLTWREHLQFPTNTGGGCEGGQCGGAGGRHPVEEEPRVPLGGLGLPRHHLSVTFHVIKAGNTNNNINWHIIFIHITTLPHYLSTTGELTMSSMCSTTSRDLFLFLQVVVMAAVPDT